MPNISSGYRQRYARYGAPRHPLTLATSLPLPPRLPITDRERTAIERSRDRVARLLEEAELTSGAIQSALQSDLDNIANRRSAACPYEQERAKRLIGYLLRDQGEQAYMVTAGNPRLRVPSIV